VASILQATVGGHASLFRVLLLNDRVFRFSVSTQEVGFHIYKLRSFECAKYKVFFNLWHGGGPNYSLEYKNWLAEERDSWTSVGKKGPDSKTLVCLPLTGANTVPLRHGPSASSSKFMKNSNFKFAINSGRVSVFKRINSKINVGSNCSTVPCIQAGVLGPILKPECILSGYGPPLLLCSKCLSLAHSWSSCNSYTRCRRCLCFGHVSGACIISPRSSRSIPANSWGHRSTESLNEGPARQVTPRIYRTFADYIKESSGKHSIPTPVIVPWSLSWRLQAPEFDEDDEPPPVVPAVTPSAVSSINRPSLGEFDYI